MSTLPSSQPDGARPARGLGDRRREELLDGVMSIIAERGFTAVAVSELARELSCSNSTLYRIAPNKDSLVVLTIGRWGEARLREAETRADEAKTSWERTRNYLRAGAEALMPLSHAFRRDVERFESARVAYRLVSDRFVDRVVSLIEDAVRDGEIRPLNARFLAGLLRHTAALVRDEELLESAGLTAGEALLEIESILFEGLRQRSDPAPRAHEET